MEGDDDGQLLSLGWKIKYWSRSTVDLGLRLNDRERDTNQTESPSTINEVISYQHRFKPKYSTHCIDPGCQFCWMNSIQKVMIMINIDITKKIQWNLFLFSWCWLQNRSINPKMTLISVIWQRPRSRLKYCEVINTYMNWSSIVFFYSCLAFTLKVTANGHKWQQSNKNHWKIKIQSETIQVSFNDTLMVKCSFRFKPFRHHRQL